MAQKGITPVRLGDDDKASLENIRQALSLVDRSDAIRVSIRWLQYKVAIADFDPEDVRVRMDRYELEHPDTLGVKFDLSERGNGQEK